MPYNQAHPDTPVSLFRVVYIIRGFEQEFYDLVEALDASEAVEISFGRRSSRHPQIDWNYMDKNYGDDMGTVVVRIEEYSYNKSVFTW